MTAAPRPRREPVVHDDQRTGRTVLVAPRRSERPGDADLVAAASGDDAADWCPFCAGNESRTPPEVQRAPRDPGSPWQARIVPNHYPFVESAPADGAAGGGQRPAHGVHDVVIESPRHDTSILTIDPAGWRSAWEIVGRRLAELAARADLAWGTVFKNSGPRAGASLAHVHSQLVALDFLPPAMRAELRAAAGRADPFADLLAESRDSGRIVAEADGLVALVPPAPRQPCETWIVPAARQPHLHAAPPETLRALADLSRDVVARFARILPGVDYNWWLHEAAWRRADARDGADRWHWHLEILPRAAEVAGFEFATGCHVTALPAGEAAARLRDA